MITYALLQTFVLVAFVTLYIANDTFILTKFASLLKENRDANWVKYLVYLFGSPYLGTFIAMLYFSTPIMAVGSFVIVLLIHRLIQHWK